MPRRAEIPVRPVAPDPVYNSQLVTQVINKVMTRGKKSSAEQIVYGALNRVGSKTGKPPVEVLEQAVKTVTPVLEVRPRRVGGDSGRGRVRAATQPGPHPSQQRRERGFVPRHRRLLPQLGPTRLALHRAAPPDAHQ